MGSGLALLALMIVTSCSSDDPTATGAAGQGGAAGAGGAAGSGATGGEPSAGQGGAGHGEGGAGMGGAGMGGQAQGGAGMGGISGGAGGQAAGAGGLKGAPLSCAATVQGATSFTEASDRWGIGPAGLHLLGNRLSVADLDGDGYPDLIVHKGGSNARTVIADAQADQTRWLYRVLMNRPAADGKGRRFVDATLESHYGDIPGGSTTELRSAHLAIAADVDNDGDLDLFSGTYIDPTADPKTNPDRGDRSQILLNDGKGVFTLAAPSAATPAKTKKWPTTGATFTDTDRDGKIDLFVGFWYASYGTTDFGVQAQLYRGKGDGSFDSITGPAGLTTHSSAASLISGKNHRPAYGVTSCDLDGDGAPELLVSAYGRQWNLLYQNDGKGAFAEVGQASGFAGDDNRDYSDNQFFACYCTAHPDQADCQGVAPPQTNCPTPAGSSWRAGADDQPWRLNGNTFSTLCADLDGDGVNDLYNAEIAHWHIGQSSDKSQILRNRSADKSLSFERVPTAAAGTVIPHPTDGWNEGGIFAAGADLDNDGRLDLFLGTTDYPDQYGYLFQQQPDGRFAEVGAAWNLHQPCASGVAIADFDRDGDLDVILGAGTARDCSKIWAENSVIFYENGAADQGKSLEVRLAGTTANRAGIGARIRVRTGDLTQVRDINGGYGHMAMQHDTVAFFGLGACDVVDEITVEWPTAPPEIQTFQGVATGALIELTQGSSEVKVVTSW
jgi:hypothetical protein